MRYFITGATGFIGSRVARQLRGDGHEVVAVVRRPAEATVLAELGVDIHPGDVTDKESLRRPMEGVDGTYHIAAWYKIGARDKGPAERINVEGTRNVLEVMRELAIPKGVYTSTLGVFSDTQGVLADEDYRAEPAVLSEYERTKWKAHYEVALPMMQDGLPLVTVLPGVVYGPGDTSLAGQTFRLFLRRKLPIAPKKTAFCWGHVDDTAAAHRLAMERGRAGESYIIAGEPRTLIEVLQLAGRITGIPAPRIHPAPGLVRAMAAVMAAVGTVVPLPETYTAEALRGMAGATYIGDNAKARRELGFDPRPLADGLRETLLYEMAQLGMAPKPETAAP